VSRTPHPPKLLLPGLDPGRLLANRYVLLDWLGRGGMADVYLGRDIEDGQLVAVKAMAEEHRESAPHRLRMSREAEVLRRVQHPNVIRLLDAGESEEGIPFLILEPLVGETLADYLERRSCMDPIRALPLIIGLADGLEAAHLASVVHGDIKPHNIYLSGPLDQPSSVKLIDFGLACQLDRDFGEADREFVSGTIAYMAPEQIVAEPVDARTDVYGLGVVAFLWLTGELPFDAPNDLDLLANHLVSAAPPPSWLTASLSASYQEVILGALRKDPARRYPSMRALRDDLVRIERGEPVSCAAPGLATADRYEPRTERGRRAFDLFSRRALATAAA